MADTLEDGNDGPRPPIASNMSTASSALTELPESEAQQPSKAQDATDVDSRDFASSAMDVDADNTATPVAQGSSNLEIPDNKSESGTTASTDAHTANSTLDDMSTIESGNDDASMQEDSGASSTPNAYKSRIQARHDALRAGVPTYNSAQHYTFNSVYNIPQNTIQTHAIALPPCSSSLFTGGSDGYIRRYAWYASLRNHPSERHPILRGYWENLSITAIQARGLLWNLSMQEDPSRIRFGPAGISGGTTIPVHSLAVQADEMYCLAGSAEGVVNLYSVRLDEGQCRACLGITGKAHKRNSPVSALALSEKDATLLSGAWDKQILVSIRIFISQIPSECRLAKIAGQLQQWDLNAGGQCVRDFVGHKNPISSILFRPSSNDQGIPDIEWASAVEAAAESARSKAAEDNTKMASEQSKRSGTAPTIPQASTEAEADGDAEAASPASYDPLFDDDNNASRAASMSRLNSPNSTAMEVTNTTDSAAPSGGLTFPGLNIPSSSGLSLSSLLALGDSKAAENARVPTPAKLPVIDVPNIPSYTDRTQEQLAPFPPPSIDPENTDVFLSCSTDGECLLWDRRIDKGNVRKLDLPKGCPPWSVSVSCDSSAALQCLLSAVLTGTLLALASYRLHGHRAETSSM